MNQRNEGRLIHVFKNIHEKESKESDEEEMKNDGGNEDWKKKEARILKKK